MPTVNELVLIVEDAKDTVELLTYNLQKEGYKTAAVLSGEEALTAVETYKPDLILLDIMLPGLNGWEVCDALRSKNVATPIVMLTALSTKDDRIKGLTIGADDYIPKPFSVKELMLRVKRLLEKEKTIKSLEAKAKEGDDLQRYLVHELRDSLHIIGGISGLAMEKGNEKGYMKLIKSSALHMERLLNDSSLLTRLEKGEELLPIEMVNIGEQLAWAANVLIDGALREEIDIHFLSDSSCMVKGNPTAVRQVFINIVSNAVKYNRKRGKIWIFTKETDEWVEVHVKDTGYGIPEEEVSKVFEKFYRARGSERAKGSGLGLYLVKLLMEAMGGKVSAKSREMVGSTFTVSFRKGVMNNE